VWRRPKVLSADIRRQDGSEFGKSFGPRSLFFPAQDGHYLPGEREDVVPPYKSKSRESKPEDEYKLGLVFCLFERELEELSATPLDSNPIKRENCRLPDDLFLHMTVLDPLGQQKLVSALGGRSFFFRDNEWLGNPWSTRGS
jgi:hypothetical protein